MSIGLQNQANITPPDSNFPDGSLKDNPGNNTGTYFNKRVYDDFHQFFAKMLRLASITANGLPDSEYNGFQYIDALKKISRPYFSYVTTLTQASTSAPTSVERENELGTVTWSRISTGFYAATFSTVLPSAGIVFISNSLQGLCLTSSVNAGATIINVKTMDFAGSVGDGILNATAIEVRCYK